MTTQLRPITNRDFKLPDDGWFQIVPAGEFPHPSGITQIIDKEALDTMVNRFKEEAAGENFPGLLVDFDHFSHDHDHASEAAGWITDLENRGDCLYAKARWTDVGQAAISNGRYRLVSPTWFPRDCQDLGAKRVRPLRLDRVALTNDPNIKGMAPLSNRADEPEPEPESAFTGRVATKDMILNYGTSEGARKGWETRRGGMALKSSLKKVAAKQASGTAKPQRAATKASLSKKALSARREANLAAAAKMTATLPAGEQEAAFDRGEIKQTYGDKSEARLAANEPKAATKEMLAKATTPAAPRAATRQGFFSKIIEAFKNPGHEAAHDED